MAGTLVALGEIWELRLMGLLNSQQIITVGHYRVSAVTGVQTVTALNVGLQTWAKAVGGFGAQALFALPGNYTGLTVDCQRVFPLNERSVISSSVWGADGASGNADTSNVAQVITRRTARAGRSEVSTGHLPCPTIADAIVAGELTSDQQTELTKWLACQALPVNIVGGNITLDPCIWHKKVPIEGRYWSLITEAVIQRTVRVMRRRTVGVGK